MSLFKTINLSLCLFSALILSISTLASQVSVFDQNSHPKNRWTLKNVYLIEETDTSEIQANYPKINSTLNVAVMNYSDLMSVLRYKKLEFGIELPLEISARISQFLNQSGVLDSGDELNPFLEWDIDLEATFYHVETGIIKKIDGFYTRDYVGNKQTDDWDEIATNYPFRLRFAPPLNGEWKTVVSIRINRVEKPTYLSSEFYFNVIESGDLGYVNVHENGRNLKQGDQMIYPVGTNFPADFPCTAWGGTCYDSIPGDPVRRLNGKDTIYYGHNLYSNSNTEKASNVYAWNEYLKSLSNYFQSGGKYIRTIQIPWTNLIEFEEKGNYYKRLHYAWEQDKILDSLEKYDALMVFNMMFQSPHFQYDHFGVKDWDWDYDMRNQNGELVTDSWVYDQPRYAYNDQPQGQKKAHESFTNTSDLEYHKQRTRYYLARYGYSTKIMEFEILSEPFHLGGQGEVKNDSGKVIIPSINPYEDGNVAKNAIYNYHKVISDYLKDSLKINQLVGINMGHGSSLDLKSATLPNVDVAGVNFYYVSPSDLYNASQEKIVESLWNSRGRKFPVLFTEGGLDERYKVCSDYTQHAVDMMTYPFSSVAGYWSWLGWREAEEKQLWSATVGAQEKMNGPEVIATLSQKNGNWTLGKGEAESDSKNTYAVEHQYYLSENRDRVVGYVKNRTYNVFTQHIEDDECYRFDQKIYSVFKPVSWYDVKPKNQLRVENLKKKTNYRVDWYSAYNSNTNGFIKSDSLVSAMKNGSWGIVLKYPKLGDKIGGRMDFPVVWYVIREGCDEHLEQTIFENLEKTLPLILNEIRR